MPEGPEVEIVLRTLEKQIKGQKIISTKIIYDKIVETTDFVERSVNQEFTSFIRKGKFLVIGLSKGYLIVHLRMEGKFYIDTDDSFDKHIHLIFKLNDNRYLKYHDTRKFGRLTIVDDYQQYPGIMKLGPDVLDESLTLSYLKNRLINKKIPIKQALLDQTIISGIGNIYANEILFASRIHPEEPCFLLSNYKINQIIKHSKLILSKAIEMGGTTIRSYTSSLNVHGRFDQELNVHMQKECPNCQTAIKKIYVNQRGTYYCPKCQRKRKSR